MGFYEFAAAAGKSSLAIYAKQVGGPVGSWVVNNPKLASATGVTLVGGYLFYYFTHQEYPAPWLDRRQLSSGLTKKQLLEDELTQEKAEKEDWDVIIIGSGGCGLTTGNLLARCGMKVLILEKHYVAGGCTHTWEKDGREFDTGVHYVGDSAKDLSATTGAMFNFLSDGKLKWSQLDENFDTVVLNAENGEQERFKFMRETSTFHDETHASLLEKFPDEAESIDKFFSDLRAFNKSGLYLGLYKILPLWFLRPLIALGLHNRIFDNTAFTTTVKEYLDSLTSNKKLQCILNYCFGDYGTQPRKAPLFIGLALIHHFRKGGVFPIGGSSKLTMDLAEPIAARGGKILTRANVLQINETGGNVTGVTVLPTGAKSGGKPFFVPGWDQLSFVFQKSFILKTKVATFLTDKQ